MLKRAFHNKINDNYINFLNKTNGQTLDKKSTASYIEIWSSSVLSMHCNGILIKKISLICCWHVHICY